MRQPGNEENELSINDMKDIDENTLGWRKGGSDEGGPAPQDGTSEDVTATSPK